MSKKQGQISKRIKPRPLKIPQVKILYQIVIFTSDNPQSAILNVYQTMNFIVLKHLAETLFSTYPNAVKVMLLDDGWNMFQMIKDGNANE